jgi:hypothetical protein
MIELELHPLKYEVNYKDKTYIIEAVDYFNNTDETKWIVLSEAEKAQLTNNYYFVENGNNAFKNIIFFNTKDEAVNALKTYLAVEDRLEKERANYKEHIALLKNRLELPFLHAIEHTHKLGEDFLSVHDIEGALNKKGCFRINKSNRDCGGVQVSVTYISNMLLLEKVIEEIAKENNCKVINIYNHDIPHCNYNTPLYYYWQCGSDFVRQFALLKHIF